MITVAAALAILQAAPKVVAQLPELVQLWQRIVGSFDKEATQSDLKAAYDAAISDAGHAHQTLQDIVARHS
jgi:xanthine dehydrogenase iron-sulfur cluster and FAD-binding subunit A